MAPLTGAERRAGSRKRRPGRIDSQLVAVERLRDRVLDGLLVLPGRLGRLVDLDLGVVDVGIEPAPLGDRAVLDHHGPGEIQAVEHRGASLHVFERRFADRRFIVQGRGGIEHFLDDDRAVSDLTHAAGIEPALHLRRIRNAHRRVSAVILAGDERAGVPDLLVLGPGIWCRRVRPREQKLVEDALVVLEGQLVRQRQAGPGPYRMSTLGRRCRRGPRAEDKKDARDDAPECPISRGPGHGQPPLISHCGRIVVQPHAPQIS